MIPIRVCIIIYSITVTFVKKTLLFAIPFISLVVSCSPGGKIHGKKTVDHTVGLYSLFEQKETEDIEQYKVKDFTFKVAEGEKEVLYTSISNFASLFDNRLLDGYSSTTNSNEWAVRNSEGALVYYLGIDGTDIYVGGSISSVLKESVDYEASSLYLGLEETVQLLSQGESLARYSFKGLGFESFSYNRVPYYSFSMLATATSDASLALFYDYENIYQFDDSSILGEEMFSKDNKKYSVYSKMSEYVKNNFNDAMPSHIANERKACFYYIFTNLYGLKVARNIVDMKSYIDNLGYTQDLSNSDSKINDNALYRFVRDLNDGHTTITTENAPYQKGDNHVSKSPMWQERIALMYKLTIEKTQEFVNKGSSPNKINYSTDGKVAYILLNNFRFVMKARNDDGSINPEIYTGDSFYKLAKQLQEVKEDGGVEKIILDLTTNGGGTLGVLMKLLALINNVNDSKCYINDLSTGSNYLEASKIDTNLDGIYDLEDVYGDDFKFYIYTSSYSFSCGNYLPFIAQKNGIAKIIGQTSGGGECAVSQHLLPTGENIYHSGLTRLGYYNNVNGFAGGEGGAIPDTDILMTGIYDLDKLEELYLN